MKKRFVVRLMMTLFSIGLSACNTVAGAGKDTQAAGRAVEDAAKDVKN